MRFAQVRCNPVAVLLLPAGALVILVGCVELASSDGAPSESATFLEDADSAVAALPFVETELLVQPFPGADPPALVATYAAAGTRPIDEIPEIDVTVLSVDDGDLARAAASLTESGLIETIQKNYIFQAGTAPNDPLFPAQPHLEQIAAPQAWDVTRGDERVVIAIVDTGVDADHPDLTDKVIGGWNTYEENGDYTDVLGHGTEVAGVAAAGSNNATGVAGVAWECPILAVRVTDPTGRATARHIAAGIVWAVAHEARVINVSFAPLWSNRVVRSAAQTAFTRDALVVISAGNGGGVTTAAGFREALFVGGLTHDNVLASFSDTGPFVDLVAPGVGIRTTRLEAEYGLTSGTSFAAPIVSGVAALAWSVNPQLRPSSVAGALLDGAIDLGLPGKDDRYGEGALDAQAAVSAAARLTIEQDHEPPSLTISRPGPGARLTRRSAALVAVADNEAVAGVVLSIDGIPRATDSRPPYVFVIDPGVYSLGEHELSFVAADAAGNLSPRASVTVVFEQPSGVSHYASRITFRSPAEGSVVSGEVNVQASVADDDGLALAEWFVDGESVLVTALSGTSTGLSLIFRSRDWPPGEHLLTLVITDARGVQTTANLRLVSR